MDDFCREHNLIYKSTKRPNIGRHMLLNDQTRTAFCFAPKVGCTNLKILFFLSQGMPCCSVYKIIPVELVMGGGGEERDGEDIVMVDECAI